jgi:hypothetical protein
MDERAKEGLALVAEVYDPMEADLIKSLLESHGIKTILRVQTHGSIAGIGESYGKIPIYVPESEFKKAADLLEENVEENVEENAEENAEGNEVGGEKTDRDWASYVEKKHAALEKYLSWFWFAITAVFALLAFSMPDVTDEQKTFKVIFFGIAVVAFVIMLRGLSELPKKKGG